MNKRKVLLAIIILLIFIIICILIIINDLNKKNQENDLYDAPDQIIIEEEIESTIEPVIRRNNYYIVKSCVESFYYNCKLLNEENSEEYISAVYDMLDQRYINFKNITKENLTTKIPIIKDSAVHITNIYNSEQTTHFTVYIVEGILREKISSGISQFKMIVQIDAINGTFSILLEDYIKENKYNLSKNNNFVLKDIKNIEVNNNNTYKYKNINDQTYIEDLFNHYKEEILYNTELAYYHLDEEYRNARFGTLEDFNKYAKDNLKRNVMSKVDRYQKTNEDGYTKYVYIDQFGNYYIFKETAIMSYSLILDTYTLDLPEFLDKYNQASTTEKVGYNIQRCIDAINDGNYLYVYNKLDGTFKNNYYPIAEDFKSTIKENLFDKNEVELVKALNEGNTYIFNIKVINKENNTESKNMTIIMQLLEGTDFVMSFSFK